MVVAKSLEDLLLINKMNEQANPTFSAFQSLANGISQWMEEKREMKKQEQAAQQKQQQTLDFIDKVNNSQKGKLDENILSWSMDSDGTMKASVRNPNPTERATRVKTEMEIAQMQRQQKIVQDFNQPESKLTVQDLINNGIKPTDAKEMERLRIPIQTSQQQLQNVYTTDIQPIVANNQNIPQGTFIKRTGGVVSPELDETGRPKGYVNIDAKTQIGQAESQVQAEKEALSQSLKDSELAGKDIERVSTVLDNSIEANIKFSKEQFNKFGVKPGDFLGLFDKLTPDQANQYKAGFIGTGRESAALIARNIIPGVRGANITAIFAQSAPEVGNTMEGNIFNVAASMGSAFGGAISRNIKVIDEKTGQEVPIQDYVIDTKTGLPISQLGFFEKDRAMKAVTRKFVNDLQDDYTMRVYKIAPEILQPETKKTIKQKFSKENYKNMRDEELNARIQELQGRTK